MEIVLDKKSFKKMLNEYGVCPLKFNNMGKNIQTNLLSVLAQIDLNGTIDQNELIEKMNMVYGNTAICAKSASQAKHELKKINIAERLRAKLDAKKAVAAGGGKQRGHPLTSPSPSQISSQKLNFLGGRFLVVWIRMSKDSGMSALGKAMGKARAKYNSVIEDWVVSIQVGRARKAAEDKANKSTVHYYETTIAATNDGIQAEIDEINRQFEVKMQKLRLEQQSKIDAVKAGKAKTIKYLKNQLALKKEETETMLSNLTPAQHRLRIQGAAAYKELLTYIILFNRDYPDTPEGIPPRPDWLFVPGSEGEYVSTGAAAGGGGSEVAPLPEVDNQEVQEATQEADESGYDWRKVKDDDPDLQAMIDRVSGMYINPEACLIIAKYRLCARRD